MARISLDAMGGDHAPDAAVAGAVAAAARGVDVVLVGDEDRLKAFDTGLPVVHAPEVIEMGEDPARAIREKKNASVSVAARMVGDGEAGGMVSAGSTGAALAASALIIGRIPGVLRPAIATIFPIDSGIVVIDVGANLEVKPEHLAQFGIMGSAVAEIYLGIEKPRVGLLNVGEEEGKGREIDRQSYAMLAEGPSNFIGNVEGTDITRGVADVIVADGFSGNVLLKTAEGAVRFVGLTFAQELLGNDDLSGVQGELAALLMSLKERLDPESYGGAHLVGSKGVVVIAHGSSSELAIANAISMAAEGAEKGLVDRVALDLEA
jgi:glycerol-3-phosphate acyltransferase PlsX